MSARLLVFVAFALLASPAAAILLAAAEENGNTRAPADDFGFAYVGAGRESAVYLGDGWMISANHVPLGPVILEGVRYPVVTDSRVRLRHPGSHHWADLAMFRLHERPDLPRLPIRRSPPEVGQLVFLAGNGYGRGTPWQLPEAAGWSWNDDKALRWGTNSVENLGLVIGIDRGNSTAAFDTSFSRTEGTRYEAQVTLGDSGGGAFIKQGDRWELAGVLFAADQYTARDERSATFGDLSYIADLSRYRAQILDVMACAGERACIDTRWTRRSASCNDTCGEGFAFCLVVPLLVRRRWPSWARYRRRPRAPA